MNADSKSVPYAQPKLLLCALGVFAVSLSACEQQVRVVKYDPFLGGLPGSQSNTPVVRNWGDYKDPTAVSEDQLVIEKEPGKIELVAKTGRHLMIHIHNCLQKGDKQLFLDQVLSAMTKDEFRQRGLDPGEAFDFLVSARSDVDALFNAMPMGEHTPGVLLRSVGRKAYRVGVDGNAWKDLRWTGFDMIMENGNYRLRWFVTER